MLTFRALAIRHGESAVVYSFGSTGRNQNHSEGTGTIRPGEALVIIVKFLNRDKEVQQRLVRFLWLVR